jgi:SCP-2 sterol transfer family
LPEWLSDEWLKELVASTGARPQVAGANGTISVAVTEGRGDLVSYHWSYQDGVPVDGGVGTAPDSDLTLTIGRADAEAVAKGDVEPSVAYMRGRLKATGDGGLLLGLLASTTTDAYRSWRQRVTASG